MHHARSTASVRHFRLAAVILLLTRLVAPIAGVLLVFSLLTNNRSLTILGTILMVSTMVLIIAQWSAAAHTGCPLCRTPVLAPKSCIKHRRARTFAGSHRLRVALAIVLRNRFRCPYCNESTTMEVRERLRHSSPPYSSPIPSSDFTASPRSRMKP